PYPWNEAPSQRFRFELLSKNTEENGLIFSFASFYSIKGWKKLYQTTHPVVKLWLLILGFGRRKLHLLKALNYDTILVHRELAPIGPPVFEWILAKIFQKKIIYDFDDAIWMNDGHDSNFSWWLKSRWKIKSICSWSWKVSAGNDFLAEFAKNYCKQVEVMPTVVDTQIHKPAEINSNQITQSKPLTIGWTGSHSTLFYLEEVLHVIKELQEIYDFMFLVIANKDPQLPLKNYKFIKWSKETEVQDLHQMDIGIMPLEDTPWAKGKCGFKLIQYGAIGIPSLGSTIGVNTTIIDDGETGFLVTDYISWKDKVELLLNDSKLRKKMGEAARAKIVSEYSVG
ncbi:MAG: glycosyltransferase, partial [Opitutae bacterium]